MHTVDLLRQAAAQNASDLHIVPGSPPLVRINGELIAIPSLEAFDARRCVELLSEMLTKEQIERLEKESSLDFSVALDDMRYRANILFQRNGMEAIFRLIPTQIPTPEDLQIPPVILQSTEMTRGLVLVTGPTGSGKSTTIASLLNVINQKRRGNIITIEDPIEFIHTSKRSVVSQREVGVHTPSFSSALKYILRQDPDVVLIGEMRDHETISAALTVAETGHLVFASLHAVDAPQAIDRIIDVFTARQQQQVRTQLAGVLKLVVAQTLLPRADGRGRIAAREIMVVTPAISNLIRQGKTHEVYSAIEMGAGVGMISLGRTLNDLVKRGLIDAAIAVDPRASIETPSPRRRATDFMGGTQQAA